MGYCRQCKAVIVDPVELCPLCHCALGHDDRESKKSAMYPDVLTREKKIKFAIRIYVVCAIVVGLFCIYMNYRNFDGVYWSAIVAGAFLLTYIILKFLAEFEFGYRSKTFVAVLSSLLFVILIDVVTGFSRWSLNYVFPITIVAVDVLVLVLMIVNFRNWQSYISWQIFTIFLSVGAVLMSVFGLITEPFVSELTLAISALFFVGTLIIGGGRARTELKRRFHI